MALATIDDVKRVGRIGTTTPDQDLALSEWLATAESTLRPKLQDFETEVGTVTYYNVDGPAQLLLPVRGATVTAVRGFSSTLTTSPYVLTSLDYHFNGSELGLDWPIKYVRVEVDYEYANGVPEAVRDGVAMFAAFLYSQSQATTTGIRSERIGDYSYTVSDAKVTSDGIPTSIWTLLRPFRKRRPVLTT